MVNAGVLANNTWRTQPPPPPAFKDGRSDDDSSAGLMILTLYVDCQVNQ